MMTKAIFPGSFNPFHEGHAHIVREAAVVFDRVIIAIGHNPTKPKPITEETLIYNIQKVMGFDEMPTWLDTMTYTGLLVDHIPPGTDAVIRGLRDETDFKYERKMLYVNQDLGLHVPVFYIMSNKELVEVSSSSLRSKI